MAAEARSEVTLVVPPPPAVVEEERETGLPASQVEGRMAHSPGQSWRCRGECSQASDGESVGGP